MGDMGDRGERGLKPVPLGYVKAEWVDWMGGADQGPLLDGRGALVTHQAGGTAAVGTAEWRQEPGELGSGLGNM